jgi:hypothetical protein
MVVILGLAAQPGMTSLLVVSPSNPVAATALLSRPFDGLRAV